MPRIIVLGGGVIGLSIATMLTRDGHDVTVLERDPAMRPSSSEDAWRAWERRGVGQFRQPHYLQPAARTVLRDHLPDVEKALLEAGAVAFSTLSFMPESVADRAPRAGDDRFITVTGRRPIVEYAFAAVAERSVELRRGVTVVGFLTGRSCLTGVPHVTGVQLSNGDAVHGELVVDATGRGSLLPQWLEAIGARRPLEEAEDSGFVYYTRYFRATRHRPAEFRGGLGMQFECFSILSLPADADTYSVTVYILGADKALKKLHDVDRWTALVDACPLHANLLRGAPLTEVVSLGGILDRYRRFVVDDVPVVTGLIAVGDSWACTDPALGRGIAMGLMHAAGTRRVVRDHLRDAGELVRAQDEMTEKTMTPWFRTTVTLGRARLAAFRAAMDGQPAPEPSDPAAQIRRALTVAMRYDAEVFRGFSEMAGLLALPQEVMSRPGFAEKVMSTAGSHPPFVPPGPRRAEVLRILG
jgi:2-polyprenyl-6-methoxyphenol hydroxylase-like FAD-dependent oxidoreductase